MNLNNPQSMGMPRQNSAFPMAQLRDNRDGSLYNYNQPTEVIGGYAAKINPMTGEEIPQVNFAGGGIASVLESKGRRGDTMLVHMHPEEVRGLQALAMAHGGTLTINPETGLYEASFLKKLLPTIIGATLNTFAPGVGKAVGSLIPGLSEAAASTIGTGLVVGGAYGLIEGDLKKGLAAGLGAYSGANIAQSLQAASVAAAPAKLSAEQLRELPRAESAARNLVGATEIKPVDVPPVNDILDPNFKMPRLTTTPSVASTLEPLEARLSRQIFSRMPSVDLTSGPVASAAQPSLTGGIKGLFTSPESRTAFGQALGGGFQSPFMQSMAKTATFSGLANALSPEPQQLPTGGGMGDNIVYIPGGFNPQYGTGRDQPYQLPGKYYKRTPQGLVPFNPYAMAPGGRGFADGGVVDPARDPGGNVLPAPLQTPFSPYFTNPVTDPNVAATRSYIEELNRRARTPEVRAYPGTSTGGVGGFNVPVTPYVPSTGGGGGGGGGGDSSGGGAAGIVGGIAGQYLAQKGIEKGIGYLKDKFFPTEEQQLQRDAAEEQARRDAEADQMQKDVAAEMQANPNIFAALPAALGVASLIPPTTPAGTVTVGEAALEGDPALQAEREAMQREIDARRAAKAPSTSGASNLLPAAAAVAPSVASGVASLLPSAGGVAVDAAGFPIIYSSKAASAAHVAAYSKAIDAGADAATAAAAGEKAAAAAGSGLSKVIPGIQTALGLQQAYKGIQAGKSGQAALGAASAAYGLSNFPAFAALGGPLGILGAGALAALAATLTTTKEMGADDLKAYWKGVEQAGKNNATYFGQSDPDVLTRGFINLFRTNKFEFPGQEKYGRTGNDNFLRDMTSVINDAVSSGQVSKDADAITIYSNVVRPWLANMGPGTKDAETQSVVDYMMTDLVNNYMYGKPISPSQMKRDDTSPLSSYKMVDAGFSPYAGAPKALGNLAFFDQLISSPEALYASDPRMGAGRAVRGAQLANTAPMTSTTPFSEPQATPFPPTPPMQEATGSAVAMPVGTQFESPGRPVAPSESRAPVTLPVALPPGLMPLPSTPSFSTPFSAPQEIAPEPTPYSPRLIEEINPVPYMPSIREEEPVGVGTRVPIDMARDKDLMPYIPPPPTPFSEPEPREYIMPTPFSEEEEAPPPRKRAPKTGKAFNYGGAVGEDYNFGFARGGMPGEYQAGGKLLDGPGDGMSDDIPAVIRGKGVQRAALADGEFVIPADVVSHLGNGSTKAGAKKLYDMMARVRKARTGKANQAPAVKTARLMPA